MRKLITLFALLLLLSGCINNYYVTATPTPGPSPTAEPTLRGPIPPTFEPTAGPTISLPTATPVAPTATALPGPVENLLLCWGFECGWQYDLRHPTGGLKVPLGWTAFWGSSVPGDWSGGIPSGDRFCNSFIPAVELEFHPPHVKEGLSSGRVIQAGKNCPAGLYQVIESTRGASYVASGHVLNWSTSTPIVGSPSTSYVRSWIGIDPTGGTDWQADAVVWSSEESAQDAYHYLEVEATAQSSHITVFLLSIPNFAVARSDSFWDDLSAVEVAGPQPTPAPIVETTPLPGWEAPDQLGTIVYSETTNLRVCADALWASAFDPTTCPYSVDGFEAIQTMQVGNKAGVIKWGVDRYGNRWARYLLLEGGTSQVSVACYKSSPRGQFYAEVQVSQYDGLKAKGLLPSALNPCLVK